MRVWLARFVRYGPNDYIAVLEALVLVLAARAALRWMSIERIGRRVSNRIADPKPVDDTGRKVLARCAWAIAVAAKRSPARALCFERGIAATLMLRRRGYDPTLYYGLRLGEEAHTLKAHVWVMVDGYGISGTDHAGDYKVMTSFPQDRETSGHSVRTQLQPWWSS